jgi:two-component system, OmpR family, response regulator
MPNAATKILFVDDDESIRLLVSGYLSGHEMSVQGEPDGFGMWRSLENDRFDLVLLDVLLPDANGVDLCRKLRGRSKVPIILLTAVSGTSERIAGLDVGADDYLTKPFDPGELLARIRAVLRRFQSASGTGSGRVFFDGWQMDIGRRALFDPGGVFIELTSNEFDLLAVFVQEPQSVLSRDRLVDLTFGKSSELAGRSVDVLISRLRRKLERGVDGQAIIKTVRNEGYAFAPKVIVAQA